MTGIAATPSNYFDSYSDHGDYLLYLNGRFIVTVLNGGTDAGGEEYVHELTRAVEYDDYDERTKQSDRFSIGCTPDNEYELVWIDGAAFIAEIQSGEYVEWIPGERTLADAVAHVANFEREQTAFDDDADTTAAGIVAHVRNTVAMFGNGGPGGLSMEYDESDEYVLYAQILIATDDEITAALADVNFCATHGNYAGRDCAKHEGR